MGANSSKCIVKARVKILLEQKSKMVLCTFISAYALLKTFSYTSLNIAANDSKCKTKSIVGENDPYKVLKKHHIFQPKRLKMVLMYLVFPLVLHSISF